MAKIMIEDEQFKKKNNDKYNKQGEKVDQIEIDKYAHKKMKQDDKITQQLNILKEQMDQDAKIELKKKEARDK